MGYVRKGEKGNHDTRPDVLHGQATDSRPTEADVQRIWFKVVYVFDIFSQTDGVGIA